MVIGSSSARYWSIGYMSTAKGQGANDAESQGARSQGNVVARNDT
jgi:hypothetical protein